MPKGYANKYKEIRKMSFDQYVSSDCSWEYTLLDFLRVGGEPNQLVDRHGNLDIGLDMDFVGRYDSLRLDFAYFCGKIGLPNLRLYRENESRPLEKRMHVSSVLKTEKARSLLQNKHDLELDFFGYNINYNEYAVSWEKYMM